jgi:ABC-type arginine/histidine transport system permease subunit
MTMKYKAKFILCIFLFQLPMEVREIILCLHLPICPIKKLATILRIQPLLVFFFLFYFSLPSFDQLNSLSLWVINLDSLVLKVH